MSGNPGGRPRGIEDRRNRIRALFEAHMEGVVGVVVRAALEGDLAACGLLLDKSVPSLRPVDWPIRLSTADAGSVANAMAAGETTTEQAAQAASTLLTAWKTRELIEFEQRLAALEARHVEAS